MWKAVTLAGYQYKENPFYKTCNDTNESCFKTQVDYHNYQYNVETVLPDIDYKEASKKESAHHSMSLYEETQTTTSAYYYETHYLNDDHFEVCSDAEPEQLPEENMFVETSSTTFTT